MKNFANFERVYAALNGAERAINTISIRDITEYGEHSFFQARGQVRKEIATARDGLREWFKKNFPRTAADAYRAEQFTFKGFFAMLRKYPELAKDNEEALASLLSSLRSANPATTGLHEIPKLEEFVK